MANELRVFKKDHLLERLTTSVSHSWHLLLEPQEGAPADFSWVSLYRQVEVFLIVEQSQLLGMDAATHSQLGKIALKNCQDLCERVEKFVSKLQRTLTELRLELRGQLTSKRLLPSLMVKCTPKEKLAEYVRSLADQIDSTPEEALSTLNSHLNEVVSFY